ncbi:39S ribosomal protein L22, mitochondrial [Coemansia javaensis]|uniref:39S ribosomal protein L22, mitochondrial n=1 Tax=Coemansia javaensis TaxID=2761396 RepID=A0A9W8H2D7_9FUNG|nr:39S ribosomal protein L22, mitochondrial [Coemansia javaensis]
MLGLIRGVARRAATAARAVHTSSSAGAPPPPPPAVPKRAEASASSAFDVAQSEAAQSTGLIQVRGRLGQGTTQVREATFKTDNFAASPRKLRMIANQITGLPIGEAIRQMQFSAKKAARVIRSSLEWAQQAGAREREMDPANMFLKVVRVGKGRYGKKLDIKGRGRTGLIRKPTAHLMYVVQEKQPDQPPVPRNAIERALMVGVLPKRRVKGFKLAKNVWTPLDERKPVINPKPFYNW